MSIFFKWRINAAPEASCCEKWQSEKLMELPPRYFDIDKVLINGLRTSFRALRCWVSSLLPLIDPAKFVNGDVRNVPRALQFSFKTWTAWWFRDGNRFINSSKIGSVSNIQRPWLHKHGVDGFPAGCNALNQSSFSKANKCVCISL